MPMLFVSACLDVVMLFVLLVSVPESEESEVVLRVIIVPVVGLIIVSCAIETETVDVNAVFPSTAAQSHLCSCGTAACSAWPCRGRDCVPIYL